MGDPEGRRIAKHRALLFAEAAQIARLLKTRLARAGYDTSVCDALIRDLGGHENSYLIKAYGPVKSRKKPRRRSPQPLTDERQANYIYIDENGNSKPEPVNRPTFFSLGAVSMTHESAVKYQAAADKIKNAFFRTTDLTFHEPSMRNRDGIYYFNGDEHKQQAFENAITDLIKTTDFVAFGVGVRKRAYEDFMEGASDPYLPIDVYSLAIDLLLERYVDYLAYKSENTIGRITFESQGPKEDAEHQLEYSRLLLDGTQWVHSSDFRNWLETRLTYVPKSGSHPVELADIFSRDLYEWTRGNCQSNPHRWELFQSKIYLRGDGMRGKFGVKIFPDSDIRDIIEAHRFRCGEIGSN